MTTECHNRRLLGRGGGFTLIELLVVISIIALLLSIMMPALNRARHQARVVVCANNIRQMIVGMNTYASSYRNRYPERPTDAFPPKIWWKGRDEAVLTMFHDYIIADAKTAKLTFCPLIHSESWLKPRLELGGAAPTEREEQFARYLYVKHTGYFIGYSMFAGMVPDPVTGTDFFDWRYSGNKSRVETPLVAGSSRDAVLADFIQLRTSDWYSSHLPGAGQMVQAWKSRPTVLTDPNPKAPDEFGGLNVGFGDGHVDRRRETQNSVRTQNTSDRRWYVY